MEKLPKLSTVSRFSPTKDELDAIRLFDARHDDGLDYFKNCLRPRYDRSYKLYRAFGGDRWKEIVASGQTWRCVSEDTEILSPEGWKGIGQLKKGDKVFSYDTENGAILPDTVIDSYSYHLDNEKMVSIKNSKTDQLLTTNHRVLLKRLRKIKSPDKIHLKDPRKRSWVEKYSYEEAGSLNDGAVEYRMPVSGVYNGTLSIGGDYAELIGWFLTDGCIPKKGNPYIMQAKPEGIAKIRLLVASLGVECREWSRKKEKDNWKDEHRFYFPRNGEAMRRILPLIPGRKPSFQLWNLTLSDKRRLLDGICYGDGSTRPDGTYHMVSKPYRDFMEWLQVFLHLMGLRAKLGDKYVNIAYTDTIDVYGKKGIKNVSYSGRVWSVTTGRTNYIARRNGHIFITGNSNVNIPYIQANVETLIPRMLDARPDLGVRGRTSESKARASAVTGLFGWAWERGITDAVIEEWVRATLIYGIGWVYAFWKVNKDGTKYDYPAIDAVDNYSFIYDWRSIRHESKMFFMRRRILTAEDIMVRKPNLDVDRLASALKSPRKRDLEDYASVRYEVRTTHASLSKTATKADVGAASWSSNMHYGSSTSKIIFHETFETWYPLEGERSFWVDGWPVERKDIVKGEISNPFVDLAYLRPPFEYEGIGIPLILESPQLALNTIKNQRIDAGTMAVLKMFIVSPNAGVRKEDLKVRPFGIVWSPNPDAVKPIDFGDVPQSSYREEELLKSDMRFATGIDDASMGVAGASGSATETKHLRESTLERVRMFINHLGYSLTAVQSIWLTLFRKHLSKEVAVLITDEKGYETEEIVTKDDIMGEFDLQATVSPSIEGRVEVEKKQAMDLFQLLAPYAQQGSPLDIMKVLKVTMVPFKIPIESVRNDEQAALPGGMPGGMPGATPGGMPPSAAALMKAGESSAPAGAGLPESTYAALADSIEGLIPSQGSIPPLTAGVSGDVNPSANPSEPPKGAPDTTNSRGMNRRVDTNLPSNRGTSDPMAQIMNKANSLQKKAK